MTDSEYIRRQLGEAREEDEERYARMMAGLRGIDLDDRYPKGDENGIIRVGRDAGPDEPLPRCDCPYWQDYHNDECPHYVELLARRQAWKNGM